MQEQQARPVEQVSRMIESIYGCALDPRQWTTTLPAIIALTNSAAAVLSVHREGQAECIFHHGYEPFLPPDDRRFPTLPRTLSWQALCVSEMVTKGVLLVDDLKFLNSRFYKEWCLPRGLRHALGVVAGSGSRVIVLIANRVKTQPCYGDGDSRLFRSLIPHVCQALKIAEAIGLRTMRSEAFKATLDTLSVGIYLHDRQGRLIFMNHVAKCQIKAGNVLRIADNRLSSASAEARDALDRAIATACSDSAGQCPASIALPLQKNGAAGLIATVMALNHGQYQSLATPFVADCAVFVQDPRIAPLVPAEALARLFGLTPAERDVLLALADGRSPQGVAEVLGIALATVKSHLHKIFEKTGTSRQADLVRLVMGSSAQIATSMRARVNCILAYCGLSMGSVLNSGEIIAQLMA
jgi:DNA-binding CsgD family transcriptional regulator/PAS domain-containing protein